MQFNRRGPMRWLAAVACAIAVSASGAVARRLSPKEADEAKQQAAQQLAQPLNNQPVWNEIRSGQKQYTSVAGRETNVLIQPQGQTWRAARVPLATVGGFLFAAALLALARVLPLARTDPRAGRTHRPPDRALHARRAGRALVGRDHVHHARR